MPTISTCCSIGWRCASRLFSAACRWAVTSAGNSGRSTRHASPAWWPATRGTVADSAEAAAGREMLSRRVLAEGVSVAAEAMLPRLFDDAMQAEHPQCVRETREMMARATPAGVAAALRGMAIRPDIIPGMLAEIAIPTLVIVGEHDVISPVEEMHGIAATIPAAEFQMIPHAGHMSPLENPTAFNTALDGFLSRAYAGSGSQPGGEPFARHWPSTIPPCSLDFSRFTSWAIDAGVK